MFFVDVLITLSLLSFDCTIVGSPYCHMIRNLLPHNQSSFNSPLNILNHRIVCAVCVYSLASHVCEKRQLSKKSSTFKFNLDILIFTCFIIISFSKDVQCCELDVKFKYSGFIFVYGC